MSCENCECPNCYYENGTKNQEELERLELATLMDSWNWNSSPMEVARDIKEGDWYEPTVFMRMKEFGFAHETMLAVRDALDSL